MFVGKIEEISSETAVLMMGRSYKEGCPVMLQDLRLIRVSHWDFSDEVQTGCMVVHKKVADELLEIFRELFDAKFPIERMKLVDHYEADDDKSMADNNSSCFCFRPNTTTPQLHSNHSYGIALDINPLVNPYVKGDKVLPEGGRKYVDRTKEYKGGITASADNACYKAFTLRGYEWGGSWSDRQDYQHFSKQIDKLN